MKYAALLLLASCGALQPDRFEVSPYYGVGEWSSARPFLDGSEQAGYGVAVAWGWDLTEDAAAVEIKKLRAEFATSRLDAERMGPAFGSPDPVAISDATWLDGVLRVTTKYGFSPILVVALAAFLAWLKWGRERVSDNPEASG